MKGLWLQDQKLTYRTDLPEPEVGPGMALIKLRQAGICATDLEMLRGYYPFTGIPGHEFVGSVVDAPGNEDWVGKRVVGEINLTCGECEACLAGRPHHCENRTALGIQGHDGVLAEYFTLPVENLHAIPDGVEDDLATFTEPLAAALEIQEQVHIRPDTRVVVVGAGRLGLLIAQTLRLTGCDLRVVVRRQEPADLLARYGIEAVFVEDVQENSADLVVEVTGSPDGFALSRKAVRPAGTLVFKSTFAGDVTLNLSSVVVDEITLVGSRCGPFDPALCLLESGLVDLRPMISARFALSDGVAGFEKAAEHGILKVLVYPD
ncbi:alcohol dehydrogenase catalytic domain-containing protein [bacterium]|nr:alcohol dehydrogenase catalytic domain-containing protein [bacterium]